MTCQEESYGNNAKLGTTSSSVPLIKGEKSSSEAETVATSPPPYSFEESSGVLDEDVEVSMDTLTSDSLQASSCRSMRNGNGKSLSASFCFVEGETTTSTTTTLPSTSTFSCFFPTHKVLQGDVPFKVVKYARRRLIKSKVTSSNTACTVPVLPGDVPIVTHDQIILKELLGEGSFSAVYSMDYDDDDDDEQGNKKFNNHNNNNNRNKKIVVKFLRKKLLKNPPMLAACAADLVKEGILLSRLSHANIISIHGWAPNGVDAYGSNGRHDAFFLLLGQLELTLSDKLSEWRQFQSSKGSGWKVLKSDKILQQKFESFQQRMHVIDQLVDAVVYLHSQQCLHRDLKPDNIGFDEQGTLKVFDFDVARLLPTATAVGAAAAAAAERYTQLSSMATFQMTKRVGSPRYMSPECARGEPYNAKADVYTFALLVHELYSLEKPYEDIPSELHDDLVFYQGSRPYLPKSWPEPFRRTLEQAWHERIVQRPTIVELQRIWYKKLKPLVLADKQRKYTKTPPWKKNNNNGNNGNNTNSQTQQSSTTVVVQPPMTTNAKMMMTITTATSASPSSPNEKPRTCRTNSNAALLWELAGSTTFSSYHDMSESYYSVTDPVAM